MSGYTTFDHLSPQHVAEILKINPMQDYTCVGYAKTQHRRCHNRIRASNAETASELLTTISQAIASGRSVDQLLEDLAHLLLCRAWHQNQATSLASVWSEQIYKSQARCTSTSMTNRLERQSRQPLQTIPRRVEMPQHTRMVAGYVQTRRYTAYSLVIAHPAGSYGYPTPPASATHQVSPRIVELESSEQVDQSDTAPSSPASRVSPDEPGATASSSSSVSTPTPSVTTSQNSHQVTRRSVDSDCGICLMPLLQDDSPDDSEGKNKETPTTEDENGPQLSHPTGPDDTPVGDKTRAALNDLDWCKVQCGTSYHKDCIEEWVKTCKDLTNDVTCPTCRGVWE